MHTDACQKKFKRCIVCFFVLCTYCAPLKAKKVLKKEKNKKKNKRKKKPKKKTKKKKKKEQNKKIP